MLCPEGRPAVPAGRRPGGPYAPRRPGAGRRGQPRRGRRRPPPAPPRTRNGGSAPPVSPCPGPARPRAPPRGRSGTKSSPIATPSARSIPTSLGSHSRIDPSLVNSMKRVAESSPTCGQQAVVDVEFDLDRLVAQDLLHPGHLLNLESHRVDGLEDQGHDRAQRHPAQPLAGHHRGYGTPRARARRPADPVCRPLSSASVIRPP